MGALLLGRGQDVHLQVPGDARHRSWLEEIFLVTRDGGEPFFTWGNDPIGSPRPAILKS